MNSDTCFVLGNGPSLANVDAITLALFDSFGTNRIYLRHLPTYYVCVNRLIAEQSIEKISKLPSKSFVTEFVEIPNVIKLHSGYDAEFSFDPQIYVNEGGTVTYVCLQLAYWLGYKRVFLLGVDHKYNYQGVPNEEIMWTGTDTNHFVPNYMMPGEKWNCPDLGASERYYQIAKEVFERNGGEIINLTEGSALEVFRKMSMNEFYQDVMQWH